MTKPDEATFHVSPNEYRQALKDAEQTTFKDPARKAEVLGTIYDHMTDSALAHNQPLDMIAYFDAASKVAGDNHGAKPWMKCQAYAMLKDFDDAAKECTAQIEGHGNYLLSHYWRGDAYLQLRQWDASIADYSIVAESSDNWDRVAAAIDISLAYGKKHDPAGQLAYMDKHSFMFNEQWQTKEDLAIAFNNRCYALKELGRLREALDDCTRSLSYDRIPDAFAKQQELLKLLKSDAK